MKRNNVSEADGNPTGRIKIARRQDPVSCNFCRVKKLKCNRVSPCSNCCTRNVQCIFGSQNSDSSDLKNRESSSETNGSTESREIPHSRINHLQLSDLDNRLRRLETLASSYANPNPLNHQNESTFDQSKLKFPGSNDNNNSSASLVRYAAVRRTEQDALDTADELESAAISSIPCVYSMVWRETDTRHEKTDFAERLSASLITTEADMPAQEPKLTCAQMLAIFPNVELGTLLLEYYEDQANWMYHILHIPTTKAQMKDNYARLYAKQPCDYGQMGLIATIFATSAYFWFPPPPSSPISESVRQIQLYFSHENSLHCAHRWSQLAHHCLSKARFIASPTIETIQAVIILSHFLLPNEGATATYTALLGAMVNSAHTLRMHQIDSKKSIKEREDAIRRGEKIDMIQLELKRRIWWHLTSSDWILTFYSGPQANTYVVHPNQFNVSLPLDIDDVNLTSESSLTSVDSSKPTEMLFFIYRCKMSIIFREIVDCATSQGLEIEELPYDKVLGFDKSCRDLMANAPYWFQLDSKSRARSKQIELEHPYIVKHRLLCHFGIQTRLTRLHRPFLIRGAHDPAYAYSRMMCLQSARTVINLEKQMSSAYGEGNSYPKPFWFIIHHVFVATVILGMDYCFNQDDLGNEIKKQEIMDCCKVLERSQWQSEIAKRGVEQLKRVLRQWRGKVDGDLRSENKDESIPTFRSSPPPEPNHTDAIFRRDEFSFLTNAPPMPENAKSTMNTWDQPNLHVNGNGIGLEESRPTGTDDAEYTDLNWFSEFDFDAQSSAALDWDGLFRDLESQPGFEDLL